MKCLDAGDRKTLLDLIVEAELVEVVYARVEKGSIYCTIQPRKKNHGNVSRTIDTARTAPIGPGDIFTE